jgi:hypothetical protein
LRISRGTHHCAAASKIAPKMTIKIPSDTIGQARSLTEYPSTDLNGAHS